MHVVPGQPWYSHDREPQSPPLKRLNGTIEQITYMVHMVCMAGRNNYQDEMIRISDNDNYGKL